MKIDLNNKYFCYILGLLWADGYISKDRRIGVTMLYDDLSTLSYIFDKISNKWKYLERERIDNRTGKLYHKTLTIRINDKRLFQFLSDNDYNIKSKTSPDKIIEKLEHNNLKYFIRGYFDGDGNFYHKGNIKQCSITSNYQQNWEFMQRILDNLNCRNYLNLQKSKNGKKSQIRITSKDFIKFGNFIYEDFFGLKRKYYKFVEMKESYNLRKIIISPNRKPIVVDNIRYESLTECVVKLKINRSCLRYRINSSNFQNYNYV
jgi:hypothetical protein